MSKCVNMYQGVHRFDHSEQEGIQARQQCPSSAVSDISSMFTFCLACLAAWGNTALVWCWWPPVSRKVLQCCRVLVDSPLTARCEPTSVLRVLQPVETCQLLSLFICAKRQETRSRTAEKGLVVEMEISCRVFNISIVFVTLYNSAMSQQCCMILWHFDNRHNPELCSDHRSHLESAWTPGHGLEEVRLVHEKIGWNKTFADRLIDFWSDRHGFSHIFLFDNCFYSISFTIGVRGVGINVMLSGTRRSSSPSEKERWPRRLHRLV